MDVSWMYSKDPKRRVKPERGEPRSFYYAAAGITLLVVTGTLFFYFTLKSAIQTEMERVDLTRDCVKTLNSYKDGKLLIILCVKEDGALVLIWQNLPGSTTAIKIYRVESETNLPTLWKTVRVGGKTGTTDLGEEEGRPATYTVEGVNDQDKIIWLSVGNVFTGGAGASLSAPLPFFSSSGSGQAPSGQLSGQNQTPQNQSPTQSPPTSQPPASTSSGQSESPPPLPPPPAENTSTQTYYTPSGIISGTSSIPTASFWVEHVHKKIEIGWQNIPSTTNKIIIYRSKTETGGYTQLFVQENPVVGGSDFIRLDDHTINESYYYKMEARSGTTLLETYGPVFLPGLE